MQVVAFTGMPGSGKSDAVEEARRRKIPIVVMGDFVRDETKRQGLSLVDENVGRVAQQMRKDRGADVWARRTLDAIERQHSKASVVVIDGVRSLDEIATLRRRLGKSFHLVAIEAPEQARTRRLMARGRSDDSTDAEAIRRRDERERGWGLMEAMGQADTHIDNAGSHDEFVHTVRRLIDRLTASEAGGSATAPAGSASGTVP